MDLELNQFKTFKIYQPKTGYRFSYEPFVLTKDLKDKTGKTFIDFGSGCGIISVLIAKNNPKSTVVAIEKNDQFKAIISKNFSINYLTNATIGEIENIVANSVDYFICNPPYFTKNGYRISKNFPKEKFEEESIEDIIKIAKKILNNKGLLRISYHPTRFIELINSLNKHNFGIKEITPAYGKTRTKAAFVVVDAMLASKNYTKFGPPIFLNKDKDWLVI